jgi:hypothetical protein
VSDRAESNRRSYLANREERIAYAKRYHEENRDAVNERRRRARAADPEKYRAKDREQRRRRAERGSDKPRLKRNHRAHLFRKRGLTQAIYDRIMGLQEHRCGICREPFTDKVYIDHDHTTGRVRGLLCMNCNVAIGHLRDSRINLMAAVSYLDDAYFGGLGWEPSTPAGRALAEGAA